MVLEEGARDCTAGCLGAAGQRFPRLLHGSSHVAQKSRQCGSFWASPQSEQVRLEGMEGVLAGGGALRGWGCFRRVWGPPVRQAV